MKAPAHVLKALGLKESEVLSARQVGNEWIVITTTAKKLRTSATPPPPPPTDAPLAGADMGDDQLKTPSRRRGTRNR